MEETFGETIDKVENAIAGVYCSRCNTPLSTGLGLGPISPYCVKCRSCNSCGIALSRAELEFAESLGIDESYLCDKCRTLKIQEDIMTRKLNIGQNELDWLNRVRMMLQPDMSLSPETNIQSAELAAEASLSFITGKYVDPNESVDEIYMILKRMEATIAVYSVAIKHKRAEIKQRLEKNERTKYESAMTSSKQDNVQQCPKCKGKFNEKQIAAHTAKCTGNLTTKEKKVAKNNDKLIQGFLNMGFSQVEAENMAVEARNRSINIKQENI